MKNYNAGKAGEDFYSHIVAPMDFPRHKIEDARKDKKEGDFFTGKNYRYYIEVKGDHRCFKGDKPTGNLPIEIKNESNGDGEGWFYHCQLNGISEIVFVCYDEKDVREPVCSIRIPFITLEEYVLAKLNDADYKEKHYRSCQSWNEEKRRYDKTYILCIPLREMYSECGATVATARIHSPEIAQLLQEALETKGISGKVGEHGHVSFSEDDRIGGLPYDKR